MRSEMHICLHSIRPGGPAHGIVTKTVHKTLPGVVGAQGLGGYGVQGVVGPRDGVCVRSVRYKIESLCMT